MPIVKGTIGNIECFEKDGKKRFMVSVLEKLKSGKLLMSDVTVWDSVNGSKIGDPIEFEVKGQAFKTKSGSVVSQFVALT
jgi:hypothetical protein